MNDTETLQLNCPKCSGTVRVLATMVGKRVRCPRCQAEFTVPGVAPAANSDDDWLNLDQPLPSAKPATTGSSLGNQATGNQATGGSGLPLTSSAPGQDELGFDLLPDPPSHSAAAVPSHPAAAPSNPAATDDDDLFGFQLPPVPEAGQDAFSSGSVGGFSSSDLSALQSVLGNAGGSNDGAGPLLSADDVLGDDDVVEEFRVTCRICASVTYARPDQVGKQIKCHDCYSPITVPPPPKKKKVYKPDIENAETFSMFDPGEPPPSFNAPNVKSAAQLLRDAEEADAEEDNDYENPDIKNWLIGIFRIFLDPQVPVHWLLLSVVGSVLGSVMMLMGHVGAFIPVLVINLIYWAFVFACGFSVMEAVSNNEKKVSSWPYLDPSEWFGQMATVGSAAALCVGPPFLACVSVLGIHPITILVSMFMLFLLFPFVLMSMLDSGSIFVPFSAEVTKSVTRCQEQWGVLYLSSGLLFVGMFFFYLICFLMPQEVVFVKVVLVTFATIAALFTYFSMLGRLAYAIGHAVNAPPAGGEVKRERRGSY